MTQPDLSALKGLLDGHVQDEGLRPLARRTAIPLGVIRSILEGRDISSSNLNLVADKLGLEFYVGPKRELGRERAPEPQDDGDVAFLDHFDLQPAAGHGSLGVGAPTEPIPFSARWLRRHGLRPHAVSVLEIRGDSQEPLLYSGDTIIVAKQKVRPKSGRLYVVARRYSVQIKWVTVLRRAFELVSENPAYQPERVDIHDNPDFYPVLWFGHFIRANDQPVTKEQK